MEQVQTLTISNFKGKLTKDLFGDINSGLSPVSFQNFGTDPFWDKYTDSITFLPQAATITTEQTDTIMQMALYTLSGATDSPRIYGIGVNGWVYNNTVDAENNIKFTNNPTQTLNYGGGILISKVSSTTRLYSGNDAGVVYSNSLAPGTATWTSMTMTATGNVPRPMVEFLGKIYAGNGNNIAESTDGITFSSSAKLSPALPADYVIRDMGVSADGRYLTMIASPAYSTNTFNLNSPPYQQFGAMESVIIVWNGIDNGYSSLKMIKGVNLSSIAISSTFIYFIGKDDEGLAFFDIEGNKIPGSSLFDSSTSTAWLGPAGGQMFVLGNKIFFLAQTGGKLGLFCFDAAGQAIYCLYQTSLTGEAIRGACAVPTLHTSTFDLTEKSRAEVFFNYSYLPYATGSNNKLLRIHFQNVSEQVQAGSYNTQIQKFGQKASVKEVRIFTEPTVANNAFTSYLINSSATAISGSSFSYAFASGTDLTQNQGALDLIKYSPDTNQTQAVGFQFNNTGTAQITVHKVELDYVFAARANVNQ